MKGYLNAKIFLNFLNNTSISEYKKYTTIKELISIFLYKLNPLLYKATPIIIDMNTILKIGTKQSYNSK
jgi:hypothetical protein